MATIAETEFDSVRATFANIGVRQFGDPILRRVARPLELPRDQVLAAEILSLLDETMASARRLHSFSRGIGLAAPQIGVSRRVAIVHPDRELAIRMVNPRIVEASLDTEVNYEGCLSFFDVRGEVQRPVAVTIEYQDAWGRLERRELFGDAARLALHELDHLDGRLYIDRMAPDAELIEADEQHP